MELDRINRNEKLPTLKLTVVQYGILLMMLALAAGLWRLQVLGAENFRLLAEQNRIRKVPVLAARGKLFDREGRLLVDNYPSASCFLVREQGRNVDADLPIIAKGLSLDLEWQWFTELFKAVGNSLIALVLFPMLDRLQSRD